MHVFEAIFGGRAGLTVLQEAIRGVLIFFIGTGAAVAFNRLPDAPTKTDLVAMVIAAAVLGFILVDAVGFLTHVGYAVVFIAAYIIGRLPALHKG